MNIPRRVKNLVNKWGTSNPFNLCKYLGILVIYQDLGEIKGYSMKRIGKKLICINENLNEVDKLFTCAHEMGHLLCHNFEDLKFLKENTNLVNMSSYEKEANLFARELLKDNQCWSRHSKINPKYWDIFR